VVDVIWAQRRREREVRTATEKEGQLLVAHGEEKEGQTSWLD
jgi:hypothetical protein